MLQGALNELARQFNQLAHAKGWWEKGRGGTDRSFGDFTALFGSEIFEAFAEWRKGYPINETRMEYVESEQILKPEGVPIELADVIIRILDYCIEYDIDIEAAMLAKFEYNKQRPYRHGGRRV